MTIPRKIRLDLMTPPEVALRAAMAAVEAMPADTRLTNASVKVGEALADARSVAGVHRSVLSEVVR